MEIILKYAGDLKIINRRTETYKLRFLYGTSSQHLNVDYSLEIIIEGKTILRLLLCAAQRVYVGCHDKNLCVETLV